jgi:hypothetical protein
MKLVKNLVATLLLMFALGFSTYAGDLETPGCVTPHSTSVDTIAPDPSSDSTSVVETESMLLDLLTAALSVF